MVNQSEEKQWLVLEDDGPVRNVGPIKELGDFLSPGEGGFSGVNIVLKGPRAVAEGAHMRVLKDIEFRKETMEVCPPSVELGDAALKLSGPCEPVRGFAHGLRGNLSLHLRVAFCL